MVRQEAVDMSAPFSSLELFGSMTGFVLAVVVGFGFGFTLERAGFGSSRRLAAQFYLYDMTVFKVMFTSIVTAMVGLFGLSRIGWIDFDLVWVNLTYLGPQIIGGLLLGVGFILSGYCPGTSIVASASGKVDGVLTILGVMAGIALFSLIYSPALEAFHHSGSFGRLLLSDLLAIDPMILTIAIALMAALAFIGAEVVERRFANRAEPGRSPFGRPATRLAVTGGLVVAAVIFLLVPSTKRAAVAAGAIEDSITPVELARHLVEGNGDWTILDLRVGIDPLSDDALKGAIPIQPLELAAAEDWSDRFPEHRLLVLVDGGDGIAASLPVPSTHRAVILAGGFPAWRKEILTVPDLPSTPTPESLKSYAERMELVSYFTGVDSTAATPPCSRRERTKAEGIWRLLMRMQKQKNRTPRRKHRPHAEEDYDEAASIFKALGHPLRVKIVCGLLSQPCTQTHIAASLGLPQSSIAQHLDVLRRKRIVEGTRHGTEVKLRVIDARIPGVLRSVCRTGQQVPFLDWESYRDQGSSPAAS
jgi:uncharacterized membrane protein YedE/YeeE/DNA-binding transcriptional ArsR family regulator